MSRRRRTGRKPPSAKSLANLKPWPKGVSGNPKGRPPNTITMSESYRALLAEPFPGDKQGRTWAEVIALNVARRAAKGQISAAQEIADRIEGKPNQAVRVSGEASLGGPPALVVNFVSASNGEIEPGRSELEPTRLEHMLQIESTGMHRENNGGNE